MNLKDNKNSNESFDSMFISIMKDVFETLPKWVFDLPSDAYVAEVCDRMILHKKIQEIINIDDDEEKKNKIVKLIHAKFGKIIMEEIVKTNRYKQEKKGG